MDSLKESTFLKTKEHQALLAELKEALDEYDIWASTGSNSGSLPGFAIEGGLVPVGWILDGRSNAVPYSGELNLGINMRAVSFDSRDSNQSEALEYATGKGFNQTGWNPEKGTKEKEELEKGLATTDLDSRKWRDKRLLITQKRLEMWDRLTPQEQQFVSKPFPIIYGINYRYRQALEPRLQKLRPEDREPQTEEFIEGKVDVEKLTVFCPREKILEVKDYLKGKELQGVRVLPLEVFSFLVNLWVWHLPPDDILRQLTYNQQKHMEQTVWWEFNKRFPTIHSYVGALRRWEVKSPVPI